MILVFSKYHFRALTGQLYLLGPAELSSLGNETGVAEKPLFSFLARNDGLKCNVTPLLDHII